MKTIRGAATVAAMPDVTVILQTVASYDALLTAGTCMATSTGAPYPPAEHRLACLSSGRLA